MRLPSLCAKGSSRALAPVAMMICLAVSSDFLPSAVTVILPGAVIVPSPMCTAILFFFIRCVTPWLSCLATARLRFGRDAPPVATDPAEVLPLDNRRLEAELRRADRRDIAAGPGAEDDEV